MTEKEMEILVAISKALPLMSPFEKGYFLGVAESKANDSQLHIENSRKAESAAAV